MQILIGKNKSLNNYGMCIIRIKDNFCDIPIYPVPVDFSEYFLYDFFEKNRIMKQMNLEIISERLLGKLWTVF